MKGMNGNGGHVDWDVKELNATVLGFLMVCNPDHAYAQASHPNIKLSRSKTLMEGHDCCDHTWFWNEKEKN